MTDFDSTGTLPARLSRVSLMLGATGVAALSRARVTVAGLGAVGSFAVEALARSGIGALRLIDFDRVEPSNLNRQLYALHDTLGRAKIEVALERVRAIAPECRVEILSLRLAPGNCTVVLEGGVDALIDAIDDPPAKVALLATAVGAGIPAFASMGAARRRDPGAIRCDDLSRTHGCPLARLVRRDLRRLGIEQGVRCVYSTEPPAMGSDPRDTAPGASGLRSPLGSLVQVTGCFGLRLAAEVIETILKSNSHSHRSQTHNPQRNDEH